MQKWGADGKWWVCCDSRECDRETGTFETRELAVKVWNRMPDGAYLN